VSRTPAAAAVDVRAVHAAAVARMRERENHYQSPTEKERRAAWIEARQLETISIYAPMFREAKTAAEFFDDRICEWGSLLGDPQAPVLLAIADAAREDAAAAARAVAAARQLDRRGQWLVYSNLGHWHSHADAARVGAETVVKAVLREWSKLKLAEEDPDDE
jgi:hypothetical protein